MSREVLAPPLQRFGNNRQYRVNLVHEDFAGNSNAHQKQQQALKAQAANAAYVEDDLYADEASDHESNASDCYVIEELPNSMFQLTMKVAKSFYGGIIGFKGNTKRRIETETQTEIHVPRKLPGGNEKSADELKIKGKTRQSVRAASEKLDSIITSLRKRMRPTHFLGIKLNSGEVRENFLKLRQEILSANLPGIDESLFQSADAMHLTLSCCVLLNDEERANAVALLQSCSEFLEQTKTPLTIKVAGLEIFNDDPSAVRVLYGRVDAPELQQFANAVNRRFIKKGFSFDKHERGGEVKMHMTVMNIKFRNDAETTKQAPKNFDAREILKRFANFDFGSASCNELHLCVMGTKKENEFYKTSGTLTF